MLQEFRKVRQDKHGFRRLFADQYFDLYLWYPSRLGRLRGFQLCYDKDRDYHALTWTRDGGYRHESVDDGDCGGGHKLSPVLVPDGAIDKAALADQSLSASGRMPRGIREVVHEAILAYRETT
jgi:hypothetical protein